MLRSPLLFLLDPYTYNIEQIDDYCFGWIYLPIVCYQGHILYDEQSCRWSVEELVLVLVPFQCTDKNLLLTFSICNRQVIHNKSDHQGYLFDELCYTKGSSMDA